jgi:hypothetical protein
MTTQRPDMDGEAADLAARVNQRMFPDVLGTAR